MGDTMHNPGEVVDEQVNRDLLYKVMSGDVDAAPSSSSMRGALLAIAGSSSRTKSGVDVGAAAKKLGVSRRTVQRWLTGNHKPTASTAKKITTKARQAASTKRGRRATRRRRQEAPAPRKIQVTGSMGPEAGGAQYLRMRTAAVSLDPEDVEAMYDAWENGGEKGFQQWLNTKYDADYLEGFHFASVDDVTLE